MPAIFDYGEDEGFTEIEARGIWAAMVTVNRFMQLE